ncbi:MAG: hypothetical protein OXQ30_14920, partial [Boseongicola sp.]|nr:hypothetical protein [Boseongicola sp.]
HVAVEQMIGPAGQDFANKILVRTHGAAGLAATRITTTSFAISNVGLFGTYTSETNRSATRAL